MLVPADIIAAKLICQMKLVSLQDLRKLLKRADQDDDASLDIIARLTNEGFLDPRQVKKVRRYIAQFEHVRYEAVFLRRLEKLRSVPKSTMHELIARIEVSAYRRRLGPVMVEQGLLDPEDAAKVERYARKRLAKEDMKVLERYRADGFKGVGRPLVPKDEVSTDIFKVSQLFRSGQTQVSVKRVKLKLQLLADDDDPFGGPAGVDEFMPAESAPNFARGDTQGFDPDDDEDDEPPEHIVSSRYRRPTQVAESDGSNLKERKKIGPYGVIECLGQGGMGAVYLAQSEGAHSMVAVKVMLKHKAAAEDLARFQREASITAMLEHENLLRLIDQGETEDGLRWMAISLYAGKALKDIMKDAGGALSPEDAFHYFEQMLVGLSVVHKMKIIHRDLKPDNFFVLAGADKHLRIMDFGIARLMDDDKPEPERLFRTKAGVVSGSPAYIAPETISGDELDARTDIYSLGVVFYEMLTGRLPLFAETPYDYLREHLIGIPMSLFQGKRDSHFCPEIEKLMASMLAKEKDDRPQSCDEILKILREGGLRDKTIADMHNPPKDDSSETKSRLFNSFFKLLRR